ncbi:MAG: NHLP leader peptide family RiPP precursor [Isosphaeraceae bacterium]
MAEKPSDWELRWGLLVADAWADDALKQRLLSDPAAVLQERGITTPPNVQVKTIEDTADVMHLVLPMKPAAAELSEEELSTVAGGWCGGCGCRGCGCRGCGGGCGCRGCGCFQ